jgi:ankyrin repeat protein
MAVSFVRDQRATQLVACFQKSILVAHPDCGSDWISYTQNILGETSLHRAAAMNNTAGVDAIISHFPEGRRDSLDCVDKQGRTPLWHAAATGSYRALALLLDRGADANSQDFLGVTVLHVACRAPFDPAKLVEALLSRGAEPNTYIAVSSPLRNTPSIFVTPCFYAAMHNDSTTLQALLKSGASRGIDSTQSGISPLHIAAANGYLDCVKVLCRAGFDVNAVTLYRLVVHVDKKAAVDEADAQRRLGWELEEQGGKMASLGRVFSSVVQRFNPKRDTEDKPEFIPRDVAPKIRKVTLETFPLSELRTPLELARAAGHQDVVAVLQQFTGQS